MKRGAAGWSFEDADRVLRRSHLRGDRGHLRKQWEDEALERGVEQGIDRGRVEVLLKLLQLKFGEVVRERVRHASREEPELWTERVLSATSLDDVLG